MDMDLSPLDLFSYSSEITLDGDGNYETDRFQEDFNCFLSAYSDIRQNRHQSRTLKEEQRPRVGSPTRKQEPKRPFSIFEQLWKKKKFYRIFSTYPFVAYNVTLRLMNITAQVLQEIDLGLQDFDDSSTHQTACDRLHVAFFIFQSLYFSQPSSQSSNRSQSSEDDKIKLRITPHHKSRIDDWLRAHRTHPEVHLLIACWARLVSSDALLICANQFPSGFWTSYKLAEIRGQNRQKSTDSPRPRASVALSLKRSLEQLEENDRKIADISRELEK